MFFEKIVNKKETFQNLYYPVHIKVKKDEEKVDRLTKQLKELQRIQWEIMVNSATD